MSPLTHQSLKCVNKHLEPNARIQLSQRCPSLYKTEKFIPLTIHNLELDQCSVKINNTDYSLTLTSNNFLSPFDLDQFGAIDLDEVDVDGNDVLVDNRSFKEEENRLLRMRIEIRKMPDGVEKQEATAAVVALEKLNEYRRLPPGPTSSSMLNLPINSQFIIFREEKLCYNMKLHQAFRYLVAKLFSGRRGPIHVKKLSIECKGIIRVPADLRLKVSHLEVLGSGVDKIVEAFEPLFNGSIEKITVSDDFNIEHPIFQTALILKNPNENLFGAASASNVRVENDEQFSSLSERVVDLIRIWQSHGHKIGTIWNFSMRSQEQALDSIMYLRRQLGASFSGHKNLSQYGRSAALSLNNLDEVYVSFKQQQIKVWNLKVVVRRKRL